MPGPGKTNKKKKIKFKNPFRKSKKSTRKKVPKGEAKAEREHLALPLHLVHINTLNRDSEQTGKYKNFLESKNYKVTYNSVHSEDDNMFSELSKNQRPERIILFAHSSKAEGNIDDFTVNGFAKFFNGKFEAHFGKQANKNQIQHIYLLSCLAGYPRKEGIIAQQLADALYKKGFEQIKVHAPLPPVGYIHDIDTETMGVELKNDGSLGLNSDKVKPFAYTAHVQDEDKAQTEDRKKYFNTFRTVFLELNDISQLDDSMFTFKPNSPKNNIDYQSTSHLANLSTTELIAYITRRQRHEINEIIAKNASRIENENRYLYIENNLNDLSRAFKESLELLDELFEQLKNKEMPEAPSKRFHKQLVNLADVNLFKAVNSVNKIYSILENVRNEFKLQKEEKNKIHKIERALQVIENQYDKASVKRLIENPQDPRSGDSNNNNLFNGTKGKKVPSDPSKQSPDFGQSKFPSLSMINKKLNELLLSVKQRTKDFRINHPNIWKGLKVGALCAFVLGTALLITGALFLTHGAAVPLLAMMFAKIGAAFSTTATAAATAATCIGGGFMVPGAFVFSKDIVRPCVERYGLFSREKQNQKYQAFLEDQDSDKILSKARSV